MQNIQYTRYDSYKRRMQLLYAILRTIKRYRILIGCISGTICAAVIAYLLFIGSFTSSLSVSDYEYGGSATPSAQAFRSEVTYEYAPLGSDEWSTKAPVNAGTYRIRAKSKNGFGAPRYSEISTFNILQKSLAIKLKEQKLIYGDPLKYEISDLKAVGLADGDSIASASFDYEKLGQTEVVFSLLSCNIQNELGEDVTNNYIIDTEDKIFAILKRSVTFNSESSAKTYDGSPLECHSVSLSSGTLAEGDEFLVASSASIVNAGTAESRFTVVIKNNNGEDVTEFYNIKYNFGTLEVKPIELTLSTESVDKIYDGKTHIYDTYTTKEGYLLSGHTLQISDFPSVLDVGTVKNEPKQCRVLDSAGVDVTSNYKINWDYGKINIFPIEIEISTESVQKVYDGKLRSYDRYTIKKGYLASGQTLRISEFPSVIAVGTVKNEPKQCRVLDSAGNDVTSNYKISWDYGEIEISPIKIEITTGSAKKVYDATPLTNETYKKTGGSLVSGHSLNVIFKGTQTDAGTSENKATVNIIDKNGKNVTKEGYEITANYGTLEVTKRKATIQTSDADKLYDGTPLTYHGYRPKGFVDKQFPHLKFTGSQTEVGSSPNTATLTRVYDTNTKKDVTHNYEVDITFGTLTVLPNADIEHPEPAGTKLGFPAPGDESDKPEFSFTTPYETTTVYFKETSYGDYTGTGWKNAPVYSGAGAENPLFFVGEKTKKLKGASSSVAPTILINTKGGASLLPYYSNIEMAPSSTKNDVEFTVSSSKYSIRAYVEETYQSIKNNKSTIAYETQYRSFVHNNYLSIPASTKSQLLKIAAQNGIKADSPTLVTDIQNYIQHAAKYDLEADYLYPSNVSDVVIHFLTTAKAGICQHFASAATLMYRAFGIPARYTTGYMIDVSYNKPTSPDMGHAWVEIYLDGSGWVFLEVTGGGGGGGGGGGHAEYDLTVKLYDTQKIYDGQPIGEWPYEKYFIADGELAPGHKLILNIDEPGKTMVDVGTAENTVKSFKVIDKNGKDVTDEYVIGFIPGSVSILPRPITVQAASATKKHDGTPLECDDFWISNGTLLPEHEISVYISGKITVAGTVPNRIYSISIKDRKTGESVNSCYSITNKSGTLKVYN